MIVFFSIIRLGLILFIVMTLYNDVSDILFNFSISVMLTATVLLLSWMVGCHIHIPRPYNELLETDNILYVNYMLKDDEYSIAYINNDTQEYCISTFNRKYVKIHPVSNKKDNKFIIFKETEDWNWIFYSNLAEKYELYISEDCIKTYN